jgi:[ribosomal protein S5]-alanine N-acetyltransferase
MSDRQSDEQWLLLKSTAFMDAPFEPLETVRLRLRCVTPDDAHATSAMMTPEVSRWVANWPFPFTFEMAVERIESSLKLAHAGDMLPFALVEKASGEMIGWVMFNRDSETRRRGSFGYWLGEKHHGKGYMREVAPAALAAAFTLLDVDVIEAGAQPENTTSFAVMRGCGMEFTGERMVYAPARKRQELCLFYEVKRASVL